MVPRLIAHRGYPARFPENTLAGYRAAVAAGATWVETDVQFTRDGQPVLYHDLDLRRTSGQPGQITELTIEDLSRWDAAERDRFGEAFAGEPIPRLQDFVRWLQGNESVSAMIELKLESLQRFGTEWVVDRVARGLDAIVDRCVLISFDLQALSYAKDRVEVRTGWVLPAWNATHHESAEDHTPDFLIVDHRRIPAGSGPLWPGPWHWVVYSIDDPDVACGCVRRGIEFVETDAIGEMMADERFRQIDHPRTR